jgi:hypothetical protein
VVVEEALVAMLVEEEQVDTLLGQPLFLIPPIHFLLELLVQGVLEQLVVQTLEQTEEIQQGFL